MNMFVKFMSSTAGRVLRIAAGTGLVAWGLIGMGETDGYIVAGIGAIPVLTGLLNICVIGPLFGAPLSGAKTRTATH